MKMMRLAIFSIAVLLLATIASAFACVDFTCDSSCCIHELAMQKAQAPAIVPTILAAPESISTSPIFENSFVILEYVVPLTHPPLRI
jgi:hypothetical protein